MAAKQIADGLHMLPLGAANAYLLDTVHGLVLIDTGFPGKASVVIEAVRGLGKTARDLTDIVLTHAHYDHVGSLAELVRLTGAKTWMHPSDVPIAQRGSGFRPMTAAPGLLRAALFRIFVRPGQSVEPATIDATIQDGNVLQLAGGLRVVHVPGHCLGQVALLWVDRGILFAGDAFANIAGVGDPLGFEDHAVGRQSQRRLTALDFEIACFGHGKPLLKAASARIQGRLK